MKSKISLFNKAVFRHNLTGGWGLWAAITLFYLLSLPVGVYGVLSDVTQYSNSTGTKLSLKIQETMISGVWGQMDLFVEVFAFAALFCAMYVFSYLFTGRNSNMMHTFPVSRISLFVTNYVTGLLFLLVPMTLSALLALATGAVHGAVSSKVVLSYLVWIAAAAVENIFFFSMTVCVLMFVGNIFAVPVIYLILNFLYDGCILLMETMMSIVCYGLQSYVLSSSRIGVLTPMVYLARNVKINGDTAVYEQFENAIHNMNVLPGYFAVAVLFTCIAIAVYEKKHLETAGDVITVNWLKPIFRWGAAICTSAQIALLISSMFYTKSFSFILGIVITSGLLIFFIVQMLLERSVHIFTKRKIRESIIYTVAVCTCYAGLYLDVAGLEKKIPPMEEIQAVKIAGNLNLIAYEQEEIAFIRDIHSQIVRSKSQLKKQAANHFRISEYATIEYLLKDGSTFERVYQIPESEEAEPILNQIHDYSQKTDVMLRQYFGIHYPEVVVYGGVWQTFENDGSAKEVRISQEDAKQLYEAFVSDIKNRKPEKRIKAGEEETAEADTVAAETVGELKLDVRDEAGHIRVYDHIGLLNMPTVDLRKDGEAYITVERENNACVIEKLRELGYLANPSGSQTKDRG